MTEIEILLVEDNPDDARFVEQCILDTQVGPASTEQPQLIEVAQIETVQRLGEGLDRVRNWAPDVILLDLTLPDSSGLKTVDRMVEYAPRIPIVVLTGSDDVGIGVEAIQRGAQDYLRKTEIRSSLLRRSLRYAIEREANQRELRDRTHRLALLNRIVHKDLRNDLSMIVGRADELRSSIGPDDEPTLDALLQAARHAIELVDTSRNVIDELSADGIEPTPCGLFGVLDTAIDRVEADRDASVAVNREQSEDAVTVYGSTMLESAFRHLFVTAIDYSDAAASEVTVDVSVTDEWASVAISQDGRWLPMSRTAVLDDEYENPSDSRIGVGLYLVRIVLDAVDGDVSINQDFQRGTQVTLSFRRVGST